MHAFVRFHEMTLHRNACICMHVHAFACACMQLFPLNLFSSIHFRVNHDRRARMHARAYKCMHVHANACIYMQQYSMES